MTNRDFIELVASMRAAQKQYFQGSRSSDSLAKARKLEKAVDQFLSKNCDSSSQDLLFEAGSSRRPRNVDRIDAMIAARREEEMRLVSEQMKGNKKNGL